MPVLNWEVCLFKRSLEDDRTGTGNQLFFCKVELKTKLLFSGIVDMIYLLI